jgi:putative exporter of polyketide antibiotics
MMSNRFAGTSFLIGSLLRKNRIKIPIWILSIAFSVIFFGKLIPDMYTTGVDRQIMAEMLLNNTI